MNKFTLPLLILITLLIVFTIFGNTFASNLIHGLVHFPEEYVGKILTMEDGKKFTALRRLQVERENSATDGLAVFKVRFKFNSLSLGINKHLSMIPAPFLVGMEGFREKYWTFDNHTGYFQGIYQWESEEYAAKYPQSFIFKLMVKRSAEGTLAYEVIPNTILSDYIKKLALQH